MSSKYSVLTEWLLDCNQDSVCLTFKELGRIIPIPDSAFKDRTTWGNCTTKHASPFVRGWLDAGYMVSRIDIYSGWVEFTKGKPQSRVQLNHV